MGLSAAASELHVAPYSARMSPETTHKLMGFYTEVLLLGGILYYMVSASLSYFLQGV